MSVRDLANSLLSNVETVPTVTVTNPSRAISKYIPSGIFTFGFWNNNKTIVEIPLMLQPESVSVSETQRADLIPTLGGGYLCDFGQEFKDISISGALHFYYVGSTASGDIDGYTEFLKIRYMLSRYRDNTMTKKGQIQAPSFNLDALADANAFKSFVAQHSTYAQDISVIFHDYDMDEHYFVKVDSFVASRDKSDPFTVKYDIKLKAYQRFVGQSQAKTEIVRTPSETISVVVQNMNGIMPQSLPANVPSPTPDQLAAAFPSMSQPKALPESVMQDVRLFILNSQLTQQRAYLAWANSVIQSGMIEIRKAMKGITTEDEKKTYEAVV